MSRGELFEQVGMETLQLASTRRKLANTDEGRSAMIACWLADMGMLGFGWGTLTLSNPRPLPVDYGPPEA